jgi:hypothetical protein
MIATVENDSLAGEVSGDVEYLEPQRGRVVRDSFFGKYFLYADSCILSRPDIIGEILQLLGLARPGK